MRKLLAPLAVVVALAAPPAYAQTHAPEAGAAVDAAQPEGRYAEAEAEAAHAAAEAEHGEAEHGGLAALLWPTLNFIVLCGVLYYFLKTPLTTYLAERGSSIRRELVDAAAIRTQATADLAEIDRKLAALPAEIDALRSRGAAEIAAEEQRIAALAAHERERLVEQARREIELQVRIAKRDLVEHAADLAVQLATDRLQHEVTPEDQARLVDRYLDQVKKP
ncbi:MAG: hypothetical protein AB7H88_10735 [Vicinamibacterales bacterium]